MRRCGHCYGRGHNRRSCPVIRKEIKDNPNGYHARIARTKKEHASRNPRRCSYCKETGHNKKTCSELKEARIKHATLARKWRSDFLDKAREVGFGVGTLIKYRELEDIKSEWAKERMIRSIIKHGKYALVVNLRSESLDHRQSQRSYQCVTVQFPSGAQAQTLLPIEFKNILEEYATPQFCIAGAIDGSTLAQFFNGDWHTGFDSADWHLRV